MFQVNVEEIRDVLTRTGQLLLQKYNREQAPQTREGLIERFEEANGWAEKEIRNALESRYPDVHWSESELDVGKQVQPEFGGAYWVLDPIDGAVNLLQGIMFWSTSLCLIKDGVPIFAAVYDANQDEFFYALRGQGAYLNGERIGVARKMKLADAMLLTAPPNRVDAEPQNVRFTTWSISKLLPESAAVRMLGSVALQMAYVACGRMDAYWEFGREIYDWMPGALLIEEAGGSVSDVDGKPFTWGTSGIIAGYEPLRFEIQNILVE